MKAEKIINIISKLKEKITVIFRGETFELHKSEKYENMYEGENETDIIFINYFEETNSIVELSEKLQIAINTSRFEIKFKGRYFENHRSGREELLKAI
jgi:hypothetical protein